MARTRKQCGQNEQVRKGYTRRFTSPVKAQGYTVKRKSGKVIRAYPKKASTYVKAGCIKKRGARINSGVRIGPLRKGELKKFGYVYRLPSQKRHEALRQAVGHYGALATYRKLNAVAKLSVHTAPEASKAFAADREWIRTTFGPLQKE